MDFVREIRRKNNGGDYADGRDGTSIRIRKGLWFFRGNTTSPARPALALLKRREDDALLPDGISQIYVLDFLKPYSAK